MPAIEFRKHLPVIEFNLAFAERKNVVDQPNGTLGWHVGRLPTQMERPDNNPLRRRFKTLQCQG